MSLDIRNEWWVGTNDVEELIRFGAGLVDGATLRAHLLEEGWPDVDADELVEIAEEVRATAAAEIVGRRDLNESESLDPAS
jgi:hypothetical protein